MVVFLHTFLFADLSDYTGFALRHGDDRSAELAVGFHDFVRALAAEEHCEVVKTVGDCVMVRASDCRRAVDLARRIHATGAEFNYPPIRIGIDTGPAVSRADDWYGTTVNTAAHVCDAAAPGELWMTERARDALPEEEQLHTVERGPRQLKALSGCRLHASATLAAA